RSTPPRARRPPFLRSPRKRPLEPGPLGARRVSSPVELPQVVAWTDGACSGNPGPGGYGVVLTWNGQRKELARGFRKTTNNRMEILAVIVALEALMRPSRITIHSDSQYVVNAIELGWARKWRKDGWRRGVKLKEEAKNPDLWRRLLELIDTAG